MVGEPRRVKAELASDARNALGEGPTWDVRDDTLLWVDIWNGVVHRWDPRTLAAASWHMSQQVGMVVPRARGGVVVGVEDGLEILDPDSGGRATLASRPGDSTGTRLNDGKCDPLGRLWVGSMGLDAGQGRGVLYRCDGPGGMTPVLDGLTISNGLAWSGDGRTLYFIDSVLHRVDAFDFRGGELGRRTTAFEIPREHGAPDGMTIDAEGYLWVALWGGWAVHRYSPAGELDTVVELPVSLVTSCAFGGADLRDLYVTTARRDVPADQLALQPLAGGVFRVRTQVAGVPAVPFLG